MKSVLLNEGDHREGLNYWCHLWRRLHKALKTKGRKTAKRTSREIPWRWVVDMERQGAAGGSWYVRGRWCSFSADVENLPSALEGWRGNRKSKGNKQRGVTDFRLQFSVLGESADTSWICSKNHVRWLTSLWKMLVLELTGWLLFRLLRVLSPSPAYVCISVNHQKCLVQFGKT